MSISKAKRAKVPQPTVRKLATFYEGRPNARLKCVVTEKDAGVSLHHLDENPARSDVEYNLLPLGIGLNVIIDRRDIHALDEHLSSHALSGRARHYYERGQYAYGYGCSVLGASLGWHKPWRAVRSSEYFVDADNVAFFCANALINLRPLNRVDYAGAVFSTILAPVLKQYGHQIERPTCARLTMELGSYFRDAGDYQKAGELTSLARYTLRHEIRSARIRTLLARLWQHEGISAVWRGDPAAAKESFKRAEEEMTADYPIGDANAALYEAHIVLQSERPDFEHVGEIGNRYPEASDPLILTRWTSLELRLAEAQAEYQKGTERGRQASFARIREVLETLAKERIVPTRATFVESLRAFADEYPGHRIEVLVTCLGSSDQ